MLTSSKAHYLSNDTEKYAKAITHTHTHTHKLKHRESHTYSHTDTRIARKARGGL